MIALKKSSPALASGKYRVVENNHDKFFTFLRYTDTEAVLVVVSLSHLPERVGVRVRGSKKYTSCTSLFGGSPRQLGAINDFSLELPPYGMQVYKMNE